MELGRPTAGLRRRRAGESRYGCWDRGIRPSFRVGGRESHCPALGLTRSTWSPSPLSVVTSSDPPGWAVTVRMRP